jgi:hypothetical protein
VNNVESQTSTLNGGGYAGSSHSAKQCALDSAGRHVSAA